MLKLTGFDDCLVGRIEQFGRPPVAAYCVDRIIDKMVTEWGLTEDEAWEYHEYNPVAAYGLADQHHVDHRLYHFFCDTQNLHPTAL